MTGSKPPEDGQNPQGGQREEMQDLWQFRIEADKDHAFDVVDHLEIMCVSISIFEDPKNAERWIIEGTCTREPLEHAIKHLIDDSAERVIPNMKAKLEIMKLPTKDWLAENRRSFPALEIGNFYVHGSHEPPAKDLEKIDLQIDASVAFGTGSHETTRGCLKALERLHQEGLAIKNPIDVGTGTGILAIAINKLFNVPVIATDIDPDAVEKAVFNAAENQIADQIIGVCAEGLDHPDLQEKAPFDLITANILAGPLMDLSQSFLKALSPCGVMILSGIMEHQRNAVKGFYSARNIEFTHEDHDGEWVTLTLRRHGPRSVPLENPIHLSSKE